MRLLKNIMNLFGKTLYPMIPVKKKCKKVQGSQQIDRFVKAVVCIFLLNNVIMQQQNQKWNASTATLSWRIFFENLVHCDHCIFNCPKENEMIHHISECPSCDLCGIYIFWYNAITEKSQQENTQWKGQNDWK